MRLRNTDIFAAVNAVLFVLLCLAVYLERFLRYSGRGNLHEFAFYALFMLCLIGGAWWSLRRAEFRSSLLVLMQVGITAHFLGAFTPFHGGRLYDAHVFGLGYDKYVHFFNAFAGTAVVAHLFELRGGRTSKARVAVHPLAVLMVVLGIGSVVEIMEYAVTLSISDSGVGGYDNNMQDLIANFLGGATFLLGRNLAMKPVALVARRVGA